MTSAPMAEYCGVGRVCIQPQKKWRSGRGYIKRFRLRHEEVGAGSILGNAYYQQKDRRFVRPMHSSIVCNQTCSSPLQMLRTHDTLC